MSDQSLTQIEKELMNPEFARELLSMCGKVSMAYVAAKVVIHQTELDNMLSLIAKSNSRIQRLEDDLDDLRTNYRKLQSATNSKFQIHQNQINDLKTTSGE